MAVLLLRNMLHVQLVRLTTSIKEEIPSKTVLSTAKALKHSVNNKSRKIWKRKEEKP